MICPNEHFRCALDRDSPCLCAGREARELGWLVGVQTGFGCPVEIVVDLELETERWRVEGRSIVGYVGAAESIAGYPDVSLVAQGGRDLLGCYRQAGRDRNGR